MTLDYIRGFGEMTLRGLISVNAPTILKGMLNELLSRYNINVEKVVPLVEENKSLWVEFSQHHERIMNVAGQLGDLDWMTVEWFIESIKVQHRALASLFLSWRKGRNWLQRQIEEIKREISEGG